MPKTRHSPPSYAAYCSAIAFFDEHEPVDEAQFAAEEARSERNLDELRYLAGNLVRFGLDRVQTLYSRGDPLPVVHAATRRAVSRVVEMNRRGYAIEWQPARTPFELTWLFAFGVGTGVDRALLADFVAAVGGFGECALWDRLVHASGLHPLSAMARRASFPSAYDALVAALDAPDDRRAAAIGEYVASWRRRTKKMLWSRQDTLTAESGHGLWCFEAASAVLACGIDDTAFVAHKDYPRDLMLYAREHATPLARRADRPTVMAAPAPRTKPRKAPMPRSRAAKLLWHLTDGDAEAIEALAGAWPTKPEGYDDLACVIDELAGRGHAIRVDLKDGPEAAAFAARLAETRGLPEYVSAVDEIDVEQELASFAAWLGPHGYALLDVDTQADEYAALVVAADRTADVVALAKAFRLPLKVRR